MIPIFTPAPRLRRLLWVALVALAAAGCERLIGSGERPAGDAGRSPAALPTLAVADVEVTECDAGTLEAEFLLRLERPAEVPARVDYTVAGITARQDSDFRPLSGTVRFAIGDVARAVAVEVVCDNRIEPDETFALRLSDPQGLSLSNTTARATIINDDAPSLSLADTSVREGDSGERQAVFTLSLSEATYGRVQVAYATSDGSAEAGRDYTAREGEVVVPVGETSVEVPITVLADTALEPDETFTLTLSDPVGASLTFDTATATIENDDFPTLTVTDGKTREGDQGVQSVTLHLGLSEPAFAALDFYYSGVDGSAIGGKDFNPVRGSVHLPAGETSARFAVEVRGDRTLEPNEHFFVVVSNQVVGSARARVTIENDDLPTLSVSGGEVVEGDGQQQLAEFTVTLSEPMYAPVTVAYATANDTAHGGSDYQPQQGRLTFASGEVRKQVTVPVLGDNVHERSEVFKLVLSAPSATARIATASAPMVIREDNNRPRYPSDTPFSFSKLDAQGNPLGERFGSWSQRPWHCVLDHGSGLMWEVKRPQSPLHAPEHRFTWYQEEDAHNQGDAGVAEGGTCAGPRHCNTQALVTAVNRAGLCGYNDWRLPTHIELRSLLVTAVPPGSITIATEFFPHTQGGRYWSATTVANHPERARSVDFLRGSDHADATKAQAFFVRLVRDAR